MLKSKEYWKKFISSMALIWMIHGALWWLVIMVVALCGEKSCPIGFWQNGITSLLYIPAAMFGAWKLERKRMKEAQNHE